MGIKRLRSGDALALRSLCKKLVANEHLSQRDMDEVEAIRHQGGSENGSGQDQDQRSGRN